MEELDLKKIFDMFWNKKLPIILIVAIFCVIGVTYTMGFVKPVYTSSTKLLLAKSEEQNGTNDTSGLTTTELNLNSKLVSTYSELVKSKKVLREVISNLGVKISEDNLRNNVIVSSVKNTEFIEIKVTNEIPEVAAKLANEIAKSFIENVKTYYGLNNVQVVDQAEIPTSPSNINHSKDILMFVGIGAVISIIYVIISSLLDTTIKTTDEVEKLLGVPVLAAIPIYSIDVKNVRGGKRRG